MLNAPVLLLAFNRPDTTKRVIEAIRRARPPRVYVACDGPRPEHPADKRLVADVKDIVAGVNWQCRVQTLYQNRNLGCARAVQEGLDWFFNLEAEGVVLEDDCLPSPGFFQYCDSLLARYREEHQVAAICGDASLGYRIPKGRDYDYTHMFHCWGWASWRRFWETIDFDEAVDPARVKQTLGDGLSVGQWITQLEKAKSGSLDSWAYKVAYEIVKARRLTCIPAVNLVSNIGFNRADAMHTKGGDSRANAESQELHTPLRPPPQLTANPALLAQWAAFRRPSWSRRIRSRLHQLGKKLFG